MDINEAHMNKLNDNDWIFDSLLLQQILTTAFFNGAPIINLTKLYPNVMLQNLPKIRYYSIIYSYYIKKISQMMFTSFVIYALEDVLHAALRPAFLEHHQ